MPGLPDEFVQEIEKRSHAPLPTLTFTIPKGHPAAADLSELMTMLASQINVGGHAAQRPVFDGGEDIMLNALRQAGYGKQVDGILKKVADYHDKNSGDAVVKGLSVLDALIQAPGLRDVARRVQDDLHRKADDV